MKTSGQRCVVVHVFVYRVVVVYVSVCRQCVQAEQEVVLPSLHSAALCRPLRPRHHAPPLLPWYP